MTNKEDIETQIENVVWEADRRKRNRTTIFVFSSAFFCIVFGIVFASITITIERAHEAQIAKSISVAAQVERQSNGNQAMIFAVCNALHFRDLATQAKWTAIRNVEFKYHPVNARDAEYHRLRRVALVETAKLDHEILSLNCIKSMEAAYARGASSDKPPINSKVATPISTKMGM